MKNLTASLPQNYVPVKCLIGDDVDLHDGNLVTYTSAGKRQVRESDGRFGYTGSRNKKRFLRGEAKRQANADWAFDMMMAAEEWSKQ